MREIRTSGSTRGSKGTGDSRPLLSTLLVDLTNITNRTSEFGLMGSSWRMISRAVLLFDVAGLDGRGFRLFLHRRVMLMTGDIGNFRRILLFEIPSRDEPIHRAAADYSLHIRRRQGPPIDANIGKLAGEPPFLVAPAPDGEGS